MGRSHTLIQKREHKPLLTGDLLLHFVPSAPRVPAQRNNPGTNVVLTRVTVSCMCSLLGAAGRIVVTPFEAHQALSEHWERVIFAFRSSSQAARA